MISTVGKAEQGIGTEVLGSHESDLTQEWREVSAEEATFEQRPEDGKGVT